jgi:hypothetical protein
VQIAVQTTHTPSGRPAQPTVSEKLPFNSTSRVIPGACGRSMQNARIKKWVPPYSPPGEPDLFYINSILGTLWPEPDGRGRAVRGGYVNRSKYPTE